MSQPVPTKIIDKNGRVTTVHKKPEEWYPESGKDKTLRDVQPSTGNSLLTARISKLEQKVSSRINAPEFRNMLEERDRLKARLVTIKGLLTDARATGNKKMARTYGRAHLADHEALAVIKKKINDYKDVTAPLVNELEELRTQDDIRNGVHREYNSETLGGCIKTASFPSGSPEWLEQRRNGIGGSDVGAIMKLGNRTYAQANYDRVLKSKMEPISQEQINQNAANATEFKGALGRGTAWEEAIFRRFAENHPELNVMHNKDSWKSSTLDHQFANLDGIICDEDGTPIELLEIKTSSDAEEWEHGVPDGYRAQALWYLDAVKLKRVRFGVMIDDHDYREFVVEYDAEEIERYHKEVDRFNKIVNSGVIPAKKPSKPVKGIPKDKNKIDQYVREAAAYRQEPVEVTAARFDELSRKDSTAGAIERLYREHDPSTRTMNTVSLDFETTSISPETGRVIEVGMTERDPQGNVVSTFETLCSVPDDVLEAKGTGASDVHGITAEDLRGKPSFDSPEVQEQVKSMLDGRVLLAHNSSFEERFLTQHLDDYVEMDVPVVDTMKLSKMFVPDTENNKLETLATHFGVEYNNGHRALHDADVAADAYYPLIHSIYDGR